MALDKQSKDRQLGKHNEKSMAALRDELRNQKEKERQTSSTIQLLKQKLRDCEAKITLKSNTESELKALRKRYKILENKYKEVTKILEMARNESRQKYIQYIYFK